MFSFLVSYAIQFTHWLCVVVVTVLIGKQYVDWFAEIYQNFGGKGEQDYEEYVINYSKSFNSNRCSSVVTVWNSCKTIVNNFLHKDRSSVSINNNHNNSGNSSKNSNSNDSLTNRSIHSKSESQKNDGIDSMFTLHSSIINDPFTVLEDISSPTTQSWLEFQLNATSDYFSTLKEDREQFKNLLEDSKRLDVISTPFSRGKTYFYFKRRNYKQLQHSLYATEDINAEAKIVFDPSMITQYHKAAIDNSSSTSNSGLADDSVANSEEIYVVHGIWISDDGNKFVYGISELDKEYVDSCNSAAVNSDNSISSSSSGSMTMYIRDIASNRTSLIDTITGCDVASTSVVWLESRTGFFFTRKSKTNKTVSGQSKPATESASSGTNNEAITVYFHMLGASQDRDLLLFEIVAATDTLSIELKITSDFHYLLIDIYNNVAEASCGTSYYQIASDSSVTTNGNKVYYYDLSKFDGKSMDLLKGKCVKLIDTFEYKFDYICNIEEDFWFRTNYKAKNFRVIRATIPVRYADTTDDFISDNEYRFMLLDAWKNALEWIPEDEDGRILEFAGIAAHTVLVLKYLQGFAHNVLLYDLTQVLKEESRIPAADLPHPQFGTIDGPYCNFYSSEIFYQHTGFSDPGSIYKAIIKRDVFSGDIEISFDQMYSSSIPSINKYDFNTFVERWCSRGIQHEYLANVGGGGNGEEMSLLFFQSSRYLKDEDEKQPPPRPCILYVYDGFGIPFTPTFSMPLLLFVHYFDAIVVVADISSSNNSGGSNKSGTSLDNSHYVVKKQGKVDNIKAVIEYITTIKEYTTSEQLGLFGGGCGATLISSCLAQFPSLFNCAVIEDGIYDLMKFHLYDLPDDYEQNLRDTYSKIVGSNVNSTEGFETYLNSVVKTPFAREFGCSERSSLECELLSKFSPLHAIESIANAKSIPAVMATITSK